MTTRHQSVILDCLIDRAARGVLTPAEGTALRTAVRALRGQLAAAEDAATRARQLAADMRTWCSPHGIAQDYADRLDAALNGPPATR